MRALFFIGLMGLSSICIGQDYERFQLSNGYFTLEKTLTTCKTTVLLTRKKSERLRNYEKALEYRGVDLIFVHVLKENDMNPITPCRIIADSNAKFGWYLVTLEEVNRKAREKDYTHTWWSPFKNPDYRLYDKACFDQVVLEYQAKR